MSWPDDEDGDVFRELGSRHFDFTKEVVIDFSVDFETWPPAPEALDWLESEYGPIEVIPPGPATSEDTESDGYVHLEVKGLLTYALVTSVQKRITTAMEKHYGWCESWGLSAG